MKKLAIVLLSLGLFFGLTGLASAYYFEDMIDDWDVRGTTYGSVYIDEDIDLSNLLAPNTVASPFSYTHDLTDDVNFAAGHSVTEAWLELDFVNMDYFEFGDLHFGTFYDEREYVRYTYDLGSQSWVEIDTDNDIQTVALGIDWLNDDGYLDVTIDVANYAGTGDIGLDHSRVYGSAVPEPATILLMGAGLLGLAGFGRKKMSKKG